MSYQRYFIVLTEESSEYTISGKKALGKCIMESKSGVGRITFSVQNIKPGTICGAYILASDGITSTAVEIGRIIADSKGRAEVKLECDDRNVISSGLTLKDFNVAGMMLYKNGTIHAPLLGYKDKTVTWRNNFKIHNQSSKAEEKIAEKEIVKPAKEKDARDTVKKEKIDVVEEEKIIEEKKIVKEKDVSSTDFFETIEEGPAEKAFKEIAKKINEKLSEIDNTPEKNPELESEKSEIIIQTKEAKEDVDMIFRNCSKIRPFKDTEESLEWVRISPSELSYLPEEFKKLYRDYFVAIAYRKFGHLILGRSRKDQYISLTFGAPDIYLTRNEKNAWHCGLSHFKCCDCSDPAVDGKHGYWLKTWNFEFN